MIDNVIKKLENYQRFTLEEKNVLAQFMGPARRLEKGDNVLTEKGNPQEVNVLIEGWAARYKITKEGRFQTLAFLVPGDFCDIHITLVDRMDHSLYAVTPAKFCSIAKQKIEVLYEEYPRLARAFFWSIIVDESILREWLVNIGSRPADQRIAHLLCELLIRCRAAGLTDNHGYDMPLTQQQLGEAMGITPVHTSRVITRLRNAGLISIANRRLEILDWEEMKEFAEFEPNYLHLDHAEPSLVKEF